MTTAPRPQTKINTRAIEIACQADAKVDALARTMTTEFSRLREDLGEMKTIRAAQHAEAEAKFESIQRAQWSAASALILLLAGWIFYLATHPAH